MAHEFESGVFGRNIPAWHELGVVVPGLMTAPEVLCLSGADWLVKKIPLQSVPVDGISYPAPDRFGVFRDSDHRFLGDVGDVYTPLQNHDAFKFFDTVVGEGQAIYDSAGVLRNGQVVWILAKRPNILDIQGDKIDQFILLTNSHNGKSPFTMLITPIRVVCMNTLSAAIRTNKKTLGNRIVFRHTSGVMDGVMNALESTAAGARKALDIMDVYMANFQNVMEKLMETKVNALQALEVTQKIIGGKRQNKAVDTVLDVYDGNHGMDQLTFKNTAYGLYNALTAYSDHARTIRVSDAEEKAALSGMSQDSLREAQRLESNWLGSSAAFKNDALDIMLKYFDIVPEFVDLPKAA